MQRHWTDGEYYRRRDIVFDILPKGDSLDNQKSWDYPRYASVLNQKRRFRHTLLLKKKNHEEMLIQEERAMIHANMQVRRTAFQFQEAGKKHTRPNSFPEGCGRGDGFGIGEEQLTLMTIDNNYSALNEYGGIEGLETMLKTDIERGINGDESDVSNRKAVFGSNTYPRKKGRRFLVFLWEACQDLTLIILMVAAVISLVLGIKTQGIKEGWYNGANIAFTVILIIVVTATSDYILSLQFQNLNEEKQNIHLEVIRGGRRMTISIYDLVVGDVLPLKIGDQVPAGGVLISGHSLSIDESRMTGERKLVSKDRMSPFLISGCEVADGVGTMLVTTVGINTEWGLWMASISEDNGEETPLQVKLQGVATFFRAVGLSVAASVLVVLIVRYLLGHIKNADGTIQYIKGQTSTKQAINGVFKILTVAVTIVVVAVQEGLPLAVPLTLAYSLRKMISDKALVQKLSACETMGSTTTICIDKTGTLTINEMTVVEAYVGGEKIDYSEKKSSHVSNIQDSLLVEGIAQNTSGSVFIPEDGKEIEITGSPTEKAILSWGLQLGMIFNEARAKSSILHVFPFNSKKMRSGVAVHVEGSEVHLHWKGAAEIVLSCCTGWLDSSGSAQPMTPEKMEEVKKMIDGFAAASLRCIAFAYRPFEIEKIPKEDQRSDWSIPENELVLLGIVGIKDPCRPGVKDAVEQCFHAGVKVRMVTGDNIETAKAIALECGILTDPEATEPTLIEGRFFRILSNVDRAMVAEKISVMGRSSPNDKLLLVKALKNRGHVVAITGNGTNDVPAFREADIGLSMGIQGTEIVKESSDIIILDDNFASVVKVIRWGRSVYANIQKFIQFQLTVNMAALVINVVAAVSTGNVPLNAVQLLWVNLMTDTLHALALAMEPPNDSLMNQPPVGSREPLVTNIMWRNSFVQALYQIAVLLTLNFRGQNILGLENDNAAHAEKVKNTFIFNTFFFCQVFNEFNSRKPKELNIFEGIMQNHIFIGIIGITVVLQVLIIEFLGKFTSMVRLRWKLWLVSLAISFSSWLLAVVGKLIPVPYIPLGDLLCSCFPKKKDYVQMEAESRNDEIV